MTLNIKAWQEALSLTRKVRDMIDHVDRSRDFMRRFNETWIKHKSPKCWADQPRDAMGRFAKRAS